MAPTPEAPAGPPLGDVVISVPRGVAGPTLADRSAAPRGTAFAVFSFNHSVWLTDVVGLELRVGTAAPLPLTPEVVLTRYSYRGVPIGELRPDAVPDGTVKQLYSVAGFTLEDNAVVFNGRNAQGVLTQVCTCPVVSGGHVVHRDTCPMRAVTSDGN